MRIGNARTLPRRAEITTALALLMMGYTLRTLTLTQQSLWLDEVYSLIFVRGSLTEAWRNGIFPAQNPHAPAYYLPFWAWVKMTGESELAARCFSLLAGTGALATLWRLTRDVASARTAHLALTVFVLSPFGIWYAQEARPYAQYLLMASLTLLMLFRTTRGSPKTALYAAWVACALGMAYTHFFTIFTLPAFALTGLLLTWRRPPHRARMCLALVLIALMCLPIPLALLGSARTFDQADITRRILNPLEMLHQSAGEFLLRKPLWEGIPALLLSVFAGALWLMGLRHLPRRSFALALGLLVIGPLLTFWPASFWVSIFSPKYTQTLLPPLLIGLAEGLIHLPWRLLRAGALALLLMLGGAAHWRDLTDPNSQREQWHYVAQYLQHNAQPDDKIVVFADYAQPVLAYHFTGPNELIRFLDEPMAPEAFFDKIQQGDARTLWLVLAHDQVAKPNHRIVNVATARYPWSYAQYPNNGFIRVLGYSLHWRYTALPAGVTSTHTPFENGVRLVGYRIDATRLTATERLSHPPSNWIHVTAYWQADAVNAAAPHARPFLRMIGEAGEWGGDLARIPSVFEFDPPKDWPPASIIESHHDVNLNPLTPPGRYALVIGLGTDDGKPLALRDASGNTHELDEIEIVK